MSVQWVLLVRIPYNRLVLVLVLISADIYVSVFVLGIGSIGTSLLCALCLYNLFFQPEEKAWN